MMENPQNERLCITVWWGKPWQECEEPFTNLVISLTIRWRNPNSPHPKEKNLTNTDGYYQNKMKKPLNRNQRWENPNNTHSIFITIRWNKTLKVLRKALSITKTNTAFSITITWRESPEQESETDEEIKALRNKQNTNQS